MTNEKRIEEMLSHFGVTIEQVKAPTRKRHITICRHYCMIILRMTTPMSLNAIGEWFGGRDHTTVIKAAINVRDYEYDWRHKAAYKVFQRSLVNARAISEPLPYLAGYSI